MTSPSPGRPDSELLDANRLFYNALWADARLIEPERFNTWPLVRSLLAPAQRRLEVAPGLRPRLPIEDTQFIDISAPALAKLPARGAALITSAPLHPALWTAFDDFVGHRRRYEPERLVAKLAQHGFAVAHSALFGMQPKSPRLVDLGMW